ncbi:MAG: helix-turn-helix transcriptional regulator [Acidobacteriota bacterium]|nr:helix-turn-helix transcriptional regulator [Acidobacteriota bacterium]
MTEDLPIAITILRNIRGFTQGDLARASDIRNSSISDYERGRKVPELRTLEALLSAMGYPLAAVDEAQAFVQALRSGMPASRPAPRKRLSEDPPEPLAPPDALRAVAEEASAAAGEVVRRIVRLGLILLAPEGGPAGPEDVPGEAEPTIKE